MDLNLSLLGWRVTLRELDDRDTAAWARCREPDGAGPPPLDEVTVLADEAGLPLLGSLASRAERLAAEELHVVHGLALADAGGRVAVVVGVTGGAAVDLAVAGADRGLAYVTGMAAGVAPDGRVEALPTPLPRPGAADRASSEGLVGPDELGLPECPGPLRLHALLAVDPDDDLTAPALLDLADSLVTVATHTAFPLERARRLEELCRLTDACGGVLLLPDRHVDALADEIAATLARPSTSSGDAWAAAKPFPLGAGFASWGLRDQRVRRMPYADAVRVADEVVVLAGPDPARLSGIGLTIWEAAADAPTLAELVQRVVDEHGPHPEAATLVEEALTSMQQAGVLARWAPIDIDAYRAERTALPDATIESFTGWSP